MPKGLKKLTLKAIDQNMRQKGLQPKFNGMAPKGPRRTPAPAQNSQPRSAPSGAQVDGPSRNPTGFVSPAQAAGVGLTSGALAAAGGFAVSGGAGLRRIGKRPPPMGPFAPSQIGPMGNQSGSNPGKLPGSSGPTYAPVAVGVQKKGNSPKMWAKANKGNVEVTVEHTEYVRDLSGTAAFAPTTLDINPGNTDVFAWLSDLAGLFETYEFQKLEFHYNPSVGTDTDGKLLMTFDPDVLDDVPDSKQVMLEARIQLDATPWQPSVLKIPRDVLEAERYTRSGIPPLDADQHMYDVGQLLYATPGVPVAVCGELFVTYKVVFRTPNGPQPRSGWIYSTAAADGVTAGAPLGITAPTAPNNDGPLRPIRVTFNTCNLPCCGDFLVLINCNGTTFAGNPGFTASGDNTSTLQNATATATLAAAVYRVRVLDPTDIFTVTAPTGAATLANNWIRVFPYDTNSP